VMPGVEARWAADAVATADVVVLAIPLHRFPALDPGLLAGKLVIDAMNYWAPADGVVPMFQGQELSSSEIVQRRLPTSTIVKSLNQIAYQDLEDGRRPVGSPDRHAIGVAADDPEATKVVGGIIDRIGYDPFLLDSLSAGRLLQPGGPVFGAVLTRSEFEQAIHATAVRT
jgi:predicted dinucleotide-binding enzyme